MNHSKPLRFLPLLAALGQGCFVQTTVPDGAAPDVPAPDVPAPDVLAPDVPVRDVPARDAPASDVPTIDAPASDVPALDVPAPDVPGVDTPLPTDSTVSDASRDAVVDAPAPDSAPPDVFVGPCAPNAADLLFVIDNSNSMRDNQAQLASQFGIMLSRFVSPPIDPATGRPRALPIGSLHVGVISTDLGTPGSTVPSCASSDLGDDGLLNPVRQGSAIRSHQPWTTAPPGIRPARCTTDPNQYPTFLTFTAASTSADAFREDFVCNAFLSTGGCGLEQQLESVHRALVVHNPSDTPGNMDANAGFLRAGAVLGIVMVTDEEDGSTRDCRFAESGVPCSDGVEVFDSTSPSWASFDLNLRFYLYTPGSAQDPTWPIDRYISPSNLRRGLLSLKPGHPDWVVFAAIAGVPINLPSRAGGGVDWDALLGRNPDGSDGFTGMSPEGPVSMRQRNMDPACSTRVVPACRREGSSYDPARPACDTVTQYFASPSRRIAAVVRRFDEAYGNGVIGSICRTGYADTLSQFTDRVQSHLCR